MKSKILVSQLGARMHYAVPIIFESAGVLEHLYTDISVNHGFSKIISKMPCLAEYKYMRKLAGRDMPGIPLEKVTAFEYVGYRFWYKLRFAKNVQERLSAYMWAEKELSKRIIRCGLKNITSVYGFNGASLHLFKEAKRQGIRCFLEQTIAPKRIENEILTLNDSDTESLSINSEIMSNFIRIEEAEWELADQIICASDFVKNSLIRCGVSPDKCVVVQYGVKLDSFNKIANVKAADSSLPVSILFIGSVGSRKGIWTLLDAMSRLTDLNVRCRIIGPVTVDTDKLARYCPQNTDIVGSVPRSSIPGELAAADIFCLPSLCEGSATVTYEALAAGVPVITTYNSGSIVRDGVDGIIVPHSNAALLAESIRRLVEDCNLRSEMSQNALEGSGFGSLDAYSNRLLSVIRKADYL